MEGPGSPGAGDGDSGRRVALMAATVLVALSAVAAVAWWLWLPRRPEALPWAAGRPALALAFAGLQLLSLIMAVRLVVWARRSMRPLWVGLALAAGCVLFCANALNFVAPALGAPVLTIVGVAGFGGPTRRGSRRPGAGS